MRKLAFVIAAGAAAFTIWRVAQPSTAYTQSPALAAQAGTLSLRVEFGVTDTTPRPWDGTVTAKGGEILTLRNWHPRPGDEVRGTQWKLASRKANVYVRRPWDAPEVTGPQSYVDTSGVIVDLKSAAGVDLEFQTKQGNFTVRAADLRAGTPMLFLGGSVLVELTAAAQQISAAEYQNDFPNITTLPSGDMWAVWVGYRNQGNDVLARRFDGKTWGPVITVTPKAGDVYLAKAGHDRDGKLWVAWSERVNGNFDLFARQFDGTKWSAATRLTEDPQPDVYHAMATDSNKNLWIVWQGFRNGKSDIFARRYDGKTWSEPEKISASPANDWTPAVAVDAAGHVYVAWDTYDRGNYDIMMNEWDGMHWRQPVPVAASLKFEGHVSLACDKQNRLWAAWNESGMQWGKDTGFLLRRQGTRLYEWRTIGVAVRENGAWKEPAADINNSLPVVLQSYNDLPELQADGKGRLWLFFRHRTLRLRETPSDTPAHRAAWEIFATSLEGDRWMHPMALPISQGRMDMKAGYAVDGSGHIQAAWATDGRDFEEFLFQRAEVNTGRIPEPDADPVAPVLRARIEPKLTETLLQPNEDEDLKRIRAYSIDSGGRKYRIYRGDTHRHTEFSMDGNNDGSMQDTYRYAIDAASLDYLGISEHNGLGGQDVEYINWILQQQSDVWMLPKTFEPLFVYERSVVYPNGHRNVIFAERGNPTLPVPAAEQKGETGAQALYDYLRKRKGIAISHTSASSMGTDWRDNAQDVEPLVEIYQGDRVSAEYEGAPKAAHAGDPATAPGGFRPKGYVWNAWAKGYKLGIQASSDHLSTHLSYSCTLAEDFTRGGLLDAMRKRHSYGATDNIILDYRMRTGGKEYLQGDITEAGRDFQLSVKVIGTAPIRQIDLIRNDKFVHNVQPLTKESAFTYVDADAKPGESYYYVRVIQVDEQMAWSSPIWINLK